jgi:diguanylate cyclase (GGDEF)-like protein
VKQGFTVGVLSTTFGGAYFGELLGAIRSRLVPRSGRVVAIQTLDAGIFDVDVAAPPSSLPRVAWQHLDAMIVFLNAAPPSFLRQARARGLPVVVISDVPEGFDCPVIVPDNRHGARVATEHLIGHGHTAIGFAGFMRQNDIRERYEAYRATMLEHGLDPAPEYFFETGNMQLAGGAAAAAAMRAAGMPCTAVVTGNDDNAMGLVRALKDAGADVPGDVAVIGFDDNDDCAYLDPPITSVRQALEETGTLAVDLLLAEHAGEAVEYRLYELSTRLTVRESCGCVAPGLIASAAVGADDTDEAGSIVSRGSLGPSPDHEGDLRAGVRSVLNARLPPTRRLGEAEIGAVIDPVAATVRAVVRGSEVPDPGTIRYRTAPLSALVRSKEHVVDIMRLLHGYRFRLEDSSPRASRPGDDEERRRQVEDCLGRMLVALLQSLSAVQAGRTRSMVVTLSTQYLISMELLRSQERDPRSLDWLRLTQLRAGCLGLWSDQRLTAPEREHIDVAAIYDRGAGSPAATRRDLGPIALEAFPPAEVIDLADGDDDVVFVAHLKVDSGDWGMLALVGPFQVGTETGRESMNQWAALLSVALEHEAILKTLREQEEHLRRAALYDELTGLPNRAYFRDRLTLAMARAARRSSYRYAVLMLDLDGFKLVNDSLGHLAGDRLLEQVSERITRELRSIDTGARFGGDEFAILLEEIEDVEAAVTTAERLQVALAAPYPLLDTDVVVSASIGIAFGDQEYADTESIVRDADAAMYYAKTRGKRGHALFDPAMHESAVNRLRVEADLRRALEKSELELHYQPIVEIGSGLLGGAEALIRWRHPSRGLLAPGAFLPVAEESGLILAIGNWVLEESCRQLGAWGLGVPGSTPFRLSINVSNRQFWQSPVIEDVDQRLRAWGLDPGCLAVEITEGVIMNDVKQASAVLGGLHAMGVQVHIDDFGTGYSSLEALHDLSIDALKIDRSFVSRLTDSPRSRELVRTIVTMGLNLGLDVIAEGIETAEELELVRRLGCTHGQGYLYSPPVPAARFAPFLEARAAGNPARR